jgi:hypothetical protein
MLDWQALDDSAQATYLGSYAVYKADQRDLLLPDIDDCEVFTFLIGERVVTVEADTFLSAMALVNRREDLGDRFWAWADNGERCYRATYSGGCRD